MASRTILARLISAARRPHSAGISGGAALPIGRVGSSGTVGGVGQVRLFSAAPLPVGSSGGVGPARRFPDEPDFWYWKYPDMICIGVLILYDGWLLSKVYGTKPRRVLISELEGYKQRIEAAEERLRFLDEQPYFE